MDDTSPSASTSRGRGRGKSRGGLGKYLRAHGHGRGMGRPAEFGTRLVLEGEGPAAEDDEKVAEQICASDLGTNADRYAEPEPVLNSDGEPEMEPEVDLATFLERQRLADPETIPSAISPTNEVDEDYVDHSLDHISSGRVRPAASASRKGRVEIEWDAKLDELEREKSEKLRKFSTTTRRERKPAPPLPLPDGSQPPPKDPKDDMQDFLDDLLS
ncbi:hypothetical protein C8R43DRAFT_1089648 [Mycena crocata]|nr:hypothetical protein C8R43DRAFT_1089648 [Mycena crocata]